MSEKYHYGQGRVEVAPRLSNGTLGPWVWIGDVSELSGSISEEDFDHEESYSGLKGKVRKIYLGKSMTWSLQMHELGVENVARFTQGTATSEEAGTVTDEDLGSVAAGDVLQLAHFGVSDLVITDSNGTPATIDPEHYEYDDFGELLFLTLPDSPAPTDPLLASYSHSEYSQAAFLNGTRSDIALRFKGVNLAEENKKVLLELYRVSPGLLQTLSMITSGNQLAQAPVEMEALLDTSKPAAGPLGQYGRIVTIDY